MLQSSLKKKHLIAVVSTIFIPTKKNNTTKANENCSRSQLCLKNVTMKVVNKLWIFFTEKDSNYFKTTCFCVLFMHLRIVLKWIFILMELMKIFKHTRFSKISPEFHYKSQINEYLYRNWQWITTINLNLVSFLFNVHHLSLNLPIGSRTNLWLLQFNEFKETRNGI